MSCATLRASGSTHTTRVPVCGEPDGQRQADVPRPYHRHVPRHAAHCSHGAS